MLTLMAKQTMHRSRARDATSAPDGKVTRRRQKPPPKYLNAAANGNVGSGKTPLPLNAITKASFVDGRRREIGITAQKTASPPSMHGNRNKGVRPLLGIGHRLE